MSQISGLANFDTATAGQPATKADLVLAIKHLQLSMLAQISLVHATPEERAGQSERAHRYSLELDAFLTSLITESGPV